MASQRRRGGAIALGAAVAAVVALGPPATAPAATGGVSEQRTVAGERAKLEDGRAIPPANAPRRVVRAIHAANRIVKGRPYCYGGGHGRWESRCYDCSGSISYALGGRGADLIDAPMPSGSFMSWGKGGRGRWITVYANRGHMYAVIAGLRLDTSRTAGDGPGWSARGLHRPGFRMRHPRRL